MDGYLLKGILIGILFGVPAGAVGAMTVQRTLNHGIKAGLVTGLGSSVADCFYACIGAFGLTVVSDLLLKYSNVINCLGGSLIVVMGFCMLLKKEKQMVEYTSITGGAKLFFSSFSVGITNPAAILTFLFAFSWFGITGQAGTTAGIRLVFGVFAGTYMWWGILTVGTGILKKRIKESSLEKISKIFGIILIIFGLVVLINIFPVRSFIRSLGMETKK